MRKLRLSLLLPLVFLVVSEAIARWSAYLDARLAFFRMVIGHIEGLWHALNAPGLFLLALGIHFAQTTRLLRNTLHVGSDQFLFVVGGLVFWFFFGNFLDGKRAPAHSTHQSLRPIRIVFSLFVLGWGVNLVGEGFRAITMTDYLGRHVDGELLSGTFVLAWSIFLIFVGGHGLLYVFRAERQKD